MHIVDIEYAHIGLRLVGPLAVDDATHPANPALRSDAVADARSRAPCARCSTRCSDRTGSGHRHDR